MKSLNVWFKLLVIFALAIAANSNAHARPGFGWIMKQYWNDLSIVHWQVDRKELEKLIPAPLKLDTYQGQAYIGALGIQMTDGQPFGLPVSLYSTFHQINFRTYVTYNGVRGVYFFSLDAKHYLAGALAKQFFHLPYRYTKVEHRMLTANTSYYKSHHQHYPLEMTVTRKGPVAQKDRAKVTWLTELDRYFGKDGKCVVSSKLWHAPFVMEEAQGRILNGRLVSQLSVPLYSEPHFLFVKKAVTYFWPVQKDCR